MQLDRSEILRYLRMGSSTPDAALDARIEALKREVLAVSRPNHVARLSPIVRVDEKTLEIGGVRFESCDLKRTLEGADKAYLLAATLGHGVDALLRKTAAISAADAMIVQAIAATAIEAYVDKVESTLEGPRTRRYSPGYGDLALSVQREFLAALDAQRMPGITLTETCLMIPSKSVTAIIGVLR